MVKVLIDEEGLIAETLVKKKEPQNRDEKDRRYNAQSTVNIAVVSGGAFKYGLVVDPMGNMIVHKKA